jgi:ribosome-associated toxin RatA of RatAB toxin-antitoxin module
MCIGRSNLGRNDLRRIHEVPLTPQGPIALRAFLAIAWALAVATAQSAAGATVALHAERIGDAIDIHASALLDADGATAWRVLTDYNRYPEFIPNLHSSHVVARRAATVTVEQSGDAVLWLFRLPLEITFEVQETAPDRLRSRAIGGNLRALTSSYALTPEAAGTRLDYVGRVAPGFRLLGPWEQGVVERNVKRQFQALADEIERQYTVGRR